jgi:hypothetical protein
LFGQKEVKVKKTKNYKCSSALYLSDRAGSFLMAKFNLKTAVSNFINKKFVFTPRRYALENFTDAIPAKGFVLKVGRCLYPFYYKIIIRD